MNNSKTTSQALRARPITADECFTYLVAGLVALGEQPQDYPYPSTLTRARGWLYLERLHKGPTAPQSYGAFLHQLQLPLHKWWPFRQLPKLDGVLDEEMALLDKDFQITPEITEVVDSLAAESDCWPAAARNLKQILDNRPIREALQQTRETPERQADYVALRRFLIEHPWLDDDGMAQIQDIVRPFGQDPRAYYESPGPELLHAQAYWQCPCCGALLRWTDGRPACTTSLCSRRKKLEPDPGWRVWGVQGSLNLTARRRIQLPGCPEIDLFQALSRLPNVTVELWPEADRYDLRVRVVGRTWDIDIKDYERPAALHVRLVEPERRDPAGSQFYYIIPDYRLDLAPDYLTRLRKIARRRDLRLASELEAEIREVALGQQGGRHVRHSA